MVIALLLSFEKEKVCLKKQFGNFLPQPQSKFGSSSAFLFSTFAIGKRVIGGEMVGLCPKSKQLVRICLTEGSQDVLEYVL